MFLLVLPSRHSRRSRLCAATVIGAVYACGGAQSVTGPQCEPPSPPSVRVPAPVGPTACPTRAEIAGLDLEVSFEGYIGAETACRAADGSLDLSVVQKNVYRALLFMQRVEFDAPLPWTDRTLWQWFRSAINGIRIRLDIPTHGCCSPARVINLLGTGADESTIPTGYMEMMVHEARHAEGVPHNCGNFDRRISDMGAYGVQYSLLIWLGTHWPGATPEEKAFTLNRAALIKPVFCDECGS